MSPRLNIVILNLMPNKIDTENHFKRRLSIYESNIELIFMRTETYSSKNSDPLYLDENYISISQFKDLKIDGFICTGAPVEKLPFESVTYWKELTDIMKWVRNKNIPSYYICWGAQAFLYYYYGIDKHLLEDKYSGVFIQKTITNNERIMNGIPQHINIPVSRYTGTKTKDILNVNELRLILASAETGPSLIKNTRYDEYYNFNHFEYDTDTLHKEYLRDKENRLNIDTPKNYYENDDPRKNPINSWKNDGDTFFKNWIRIITGE